MNYFEILKEVQDVTLRRERLLTRLRRELGRFSRCSCNEEVIRDLVDSLRSARRRYASLIEVISSSGLSLTSSEVSDLLTLLEYNALIALNNELELLDLIATQIHNGNVSLIELGEIDCDRDDVRNLLSATNTIIRTTTR